MVGLLGMSMLDPLQDLILFISFSFLVTISSASQHVLLMTYQMETLSSRKWGIGEAMSVFTYRMAILTGGAGALKLAAYFTWQQIYLFMSLLMGIGLIAVLIMQEPDRFARQHTHSFAKKGEWVRYAIVGPFKDFMSQEGWIFILVFMVIYRLPDHLLSMMQTLFLIDLGFTYNDISNVAKAFGLGAVVLGGFVGGYWIRIYGYKKTLFWGGLAHGVACLLFLAQARVGDSLPFLYLTIGVEHFFTGIALTAFFSYQLTCCSIAFAATQLALLTSFAGLSRTLASPIAGYIIDTFGWTPYLIIVILSAIPGILLVHWLPFSRSGQNFTK